MSCQFLFKKFHVLQYADLKTSISLLNARSTNKQLFLRTFFLYLLWCDTQRAEAAGTRPDKQLQPNKLFLWRNILRKQFMAKSRYFYKNLRCKCLAESKIHHRMSTLLQVFYMSSYSVLEVINLDVWFLK